MLTTGVTDNLEVTVETKIADVEVGDVTVIIIECAVIWPPIARKLVINAKNGILNS